jgi:Holliday junction resolvase RusA-like endonuclease
MGENEDLITYIAKYRYVIPGEPVAWSSHRGFGKKSFSPHYKEKEAAQYFLKNQHGDLPLFKSALSVCFYFEMPIPKSATKKMLKAIDSGDRIFHVKRKDLTNCIKFAEDCLTGIVIEDDNIVCDGRAQKYYSRTPQTIIHLYVMEQTYGRPNKNSAGK